MILSALLLLVLYHIFLLMMIKIYPHKTFIGRTEPIKEAWVRSVSEKGQDIYAVQVLRNWIMSAQFFASTAMLIALGAMSSFGKDLENIKLIEDFDLATINIIPLKRFLLAINFFVAFSNFYLCLRSFSHFLFIVGVSKDDKAAGTEVFASHVLRRGTRHYSLGVRGYYIGTPLAFWMFGNQYLLFASIALVIFLFFVDFQHE